MATCLFETFRGDALGRRKKALPTARDGTAERWSAATDQGMELFGGRRVLYSGAE